MQLTLTGEVAPQRPRQRRPFARRGRRYNAATLSTDAHAGREFIEHHQRLAYAFVARHGWRYRVIGDAEDLVQECMVKIMAAAGLYDSRKARPTTFGTMCFHSHLASVAKRLARSQHEQCEDMSVGRVVCGIAHGKTKVKMKHYTPLTLPVVECYWCGQALLGERMQERLANGAARIKGDMPPPMHARHEGHAYCRACYESTFQTTHQEVAA